MRDFTEAQAIDFDLVQVSHEENQTPDRLPTPLRVGKWKAIVNKTNHEKVFNIVGRAYKMAQHKEVDDNLNTSLSDLKLDARTSAIELNEGARYHNVVRFPNIGMQVENEFFNLTITIDNSYDSTTGLRIEVGAIKHDSNMMCYLTERFASHYHKHTKGMMLATIKASIQKGITVFQNKVKAEFERMVMTPINPELASIKFGELASDEDTILPKKYVEEVKKAVDAKQPTTQWKLYKLVMETMTPMDLSIERRRQLTHALVKVVKSLHA